MTEKSIALSWLEFIEEAQEQILPIYAKHESHFDSYGVHGRMHISRALIFAEAMSRFYSAHGQVLDMCAIRTAVAFHDSGRQGNGVDLWEADSAALCQAYLQKKSNAEYAVLVASLILKSEGTWDLQKQIVHDADVLEIMRPCCGHGGFNGFRQRVLRFAGERDPLSAQLDDPDGLRQTLISEAWNWISATEEIKHQFSGSSKYLDDLLNYLMQNADRYPFLSHSLRTC